MDKSPEIVKFEAECNKFQKKLCKLMQVKPDKVQVHLYIFGSQIGFNACAESGFVPKLDYEGKPKWYSMGGFSDILQYTIYPPKEKSV